MKKVIALFLFTLFVSYGGQEVLALNTYSDQQQQQFTDWCTGAKTASDSTCSCTIKRLAQTVPPAALAQFLANNGSFTMDASILQTTAMVTEALTNCSK